MHVSPWRPTPQSTNGAQLGSAVDQDQTAVGVHPPEPWQSNEEVHSKSNVHPSAAYRQSSPSPGHTAACAGISAGQPIGFVIVWPPSPPTRWSPHAAITIVGANARTSIERRKEGMTDSAGATWRRLHPPSNSWANSVRVPRALGEGGALPSVQPLTRALRPPSAPWRLA